MEICDSSLCFPINSSAWADRKYAESAKNSAAAAARKKKGNMTLKNVAAAAGLDKKNVIDLQQVAAPFTSFPFQREKLLLILDDVFHVSPIP